MAQAGYTPISLYYSTTASTAPTSGNLVNGELAINITDGKLYYKDNGGTVQIIASKAGASGDVVGPASATDNAIVRFDGTTGKLVQNSVVTIADSTGDISGVGQLNATTLDATNIEVTNIKAKDGTAAASIADSTGVVSITANPVLSGGTANGVLYLNGSKVATSGSALTFDGTTLGAPQVLLPNGNSYQIKSAAGVASAVLGMDASNNLYLGASGAVATNIFCTGGSEQMRLTSTGLGIGTSSPDQKVHAYNTASNTWFRAQSDGDNSTGLYMTNSQRSWLWGVSGGGAGSMYLYDLTGSKQVMNIDTSGNLGLGVTPSAWTNGRIALQIGGSTVAGLGFAGAISETYTNAYVNSGVYKYYTTGPAGLFDFNNAASGGFSWRIAGSGTAGNAITFTQAMTLDASGNLGVGLTSPGVRIDADGIIRSFSAGTTQRYLAATNSAGTFESGVLPGGDSYAGSVTNDNFVFYTNAAERARITSGGYFKASDDGVYAGAANTWHEFNQSANSLGLAVLADNASFASTVVEVSATRNTTNNTYYFLDCAVSGVAYRLRVADSGNVTNTNGSYGTISDAKMKTDIVDAGSQWADIKAIRFRKFKMKDDPSGLLQLGVVAQELEQTSPGLVDEHVDRDADGNDLGTTTKSVKTSILLMKAAKALQEAMARIETLEAKVSALEGN